MQARTMSFSRLVRDLAPAVVLAGCCCGAVGQPASGLRRELSRADYADRLRAMWLGECIANWTGLRTEGARTEPPFYTDADWGTTFDGRATVFVTGQDPWWADDDTDVEYVYQHLMEMTGRTLLTPQDIAQGWVTHINRFIWVSNAAARGLMDRGVRSPATSLGTANWARLEIDAQLTTEVFGALCPGMPEDALRLSELPVCTTAAGYAAHAAQFYLVLYSLATQVPQSLSGRDRAVWLVQEARRYLPDMSKSADVVDFVLADFLANPDHDDWESTRDKVYLRYQASAAASGFAYRGWYESSVNLACGTMALLYGRCDYRRTVQIGTLSGWDSDNGTATMGGLLGLMHGTQWVRDQFPGVGLSDRYWIARTRDALPDRLPGDLAADDTFTMMANRLVPLVEQEIVARGGLVDAKQGRWLLPPAPIAPAGDKRVFNPLHWHDGRSANNGVRRAGGIVTTSGPAGNPGPGRGWGNAGAIANGAETDFSGTDRADADWPYYTSEGAGLPPGAPVTLEVGYDRAVAVHTVRLIEGDRFCGAGGAGDPSGGWFTSLVVQVRVGGAWITPAGTFSEALDASRPFQIIDVVLEVPVLATGIRVTGNAGGIDSFVTCSELDALSAPPTSGAIPSSSFDRNGDGVVSASDLHRFLQSPVDLDGDGVVSDADLLYLQAAINFRKGPGAPGVRR